VGRLTMTNGDLLPSGEKPQTRKPSLYRGFPNAHKLRLRGIQLCFQINFVQPLKTNDGCGDLANRVQWLGETFSEDELNCDAKSDEKYVDVKSHKKTMGRPLTKDLKSYLLSVSRGLERRSSIVAVWSSSWWSLVSLKSFTLKGRNLERMYFNSLLRAGYEGVCSSSSFRHQEVDQWEI